MIEEFLASLIGVVVTLLLCLIVNTIVEAKLGVANIAQLPVTVAMNLIAISVGLTVIAGIIPSCKTSCEDPSRLCEASNSARRRVGVGSFTLATTEFVPGQRDT